MQKARIFCVKLIIIAVLLSSVVFYAIGVFSTDPGWTHTDHSEGYHEWKTCEYNEFLSSISENRTLDTEKCKHIATLSFSLTIGQTFINTTVGLLTAFVITLSSEFIGRVSDAMCRSKIHVQMQQIKHSGKHSGSGSNSGQHSGNGQRSANDGSNNKSSSAQDQAQTQTQTQTQTQINTKTTTLARKSNNSMTIMLMSVTTSSSPISAVSDLRKKSKEGVSPTTNNIIKKEKKQKKAPAALWADINPITKSFEYIIIGGGVAAGYAAREFALQGIGEGRVAIFSRESVPPYERSGLGYRYLSSPEKRSNLLTCVTGESNDQQTLEWYLEKGISLHLKTKIEHIDHQNLTIKDSFGVSYKAMKSIIIATGSRPEKLHVTNIIQAQDEDNTFVNTEPNSKPYRNAYYLRTLEDAEKLAKRIEQPIEGSKHQTCLVIGGGYIGLECASVAALKGWHVTLVIKTSTLIPAIFTPDVSRIFENYLTENGVEIVKGNGCNTLLSDCGSIIGCRLDNKDIIKADITIVGVGTVPNTEIFKNKLQFQSSDPAAPILIDDNFETSTRGIYAIGDVASPLFRSYGLNQLQHAENARMAGSYLVKYLTSHQEKQAGKAFEYHPTVSSHVLRVSWSFFGDNSGPLVRVLGDIETKMLILWVWQGRVQGALITNGNDIEQSTLLKATKEQKLLPLKDVKDLKSVDEAFQLIALPSKK